MNMKNLLKSLVYAAYKEDASKFQDTARQVISRKTSDVIEAKKREVSAKMIEKNQ